MSDWIHGLPVFWMALVIFGGTYLVTAGLYWGVMVLATGERLRAFKGVSAGMLSPLGVTFGLMVAFVAAQVWGDLDRARAAVNQEASALRAVVLLSRGFPTEEARLNDLIRRHIQEAEREEWPAMARSSARLTMVPTYLAEAMQRTLTLTTRDAGQVAAQRELLAALGRALDGRRQRILASQAGVNLVKWVCLMIQASCTLITIAMVHSDNRMAARLAMGLFSTAVAVCLLLIAAHDRPFTGQTSIQPTALLQVLPESGPK